MPNTQLELLVRSDRGPNGRTWKGVALSFLIVAIAVSAATSRAQGLDGAEILPKGRWGVDISPGYDFPATVLYRLGLMTSPLEGWQVGLQGNASYAWNFLGLSNTLNVFRSDDDTFLVSLKGIVGGYLEHVSTRRRSGSARNTSTQRIWDSALVLQPIIAFEWRMPTRRRWSFFSELGTQHYWGDFCPDRLYHGGDFDDCDWAHGVRIAIGSRIQLDPQWSISPRVGITGSFPKPSPIAGLAFSHMF